jgi:CubicO group peptidase (beta-lactamase class C family)
LAVTPQTVFRIASITKVLSGVALLQLRDAGSLALDDLLTTHLPEAKAVRPAHEGDPPIVLRNLVTHTSGLPRNPPSGGTNEPAFLHKLAQVKLASAPGAKVSYSNFAMGLVGPIVARASGVPFREYMRTKILEPLDMKSAAWEARDVPKDLLSAGHQRIKEEGPDKGKLKVSDTEWRMGAGEAFGGLYVSLDDMTKLARFELSSQADGEEAYANVLSRASLQESQREAITGAEGTPSYGVNWVVAKDETYGALVYHTGATDEYSASLVLYPERGLGVVILSNAAAPSDVEAVAKRILAKTAEAYASSK